MDVTWADVQHLAEVHLVPFAVRLLVALTVFLIGRWFARMVTKGFVRLMERSRLDISLRKFLSDLVYAVSIVAVVIAALDSLGVETTAVVAVIGAAGLAIGLALQGSLSNFAAGVMLIVLRPYKVGDLVAIGKYLGRVEGIKVFHTVLITGDFREITIPNGQIIAQPIENLTVLGRRRVDLVVSVNQATDLKRVRKLLEDVVAEDKRVQHDPPTTIDVAEITAESVKLYVRPWTSVDNFSAVTTETMERIKDSMEAAGLKFSVSVQA
ncbi:MAG: mechanosensitive ion channel [Kofleriaceae bacterium]|nr:mechanosensitive ion channel [Kofleriaceae bacterium]